MNKPKSFRLQHRDELEPSSQQGVGNRPWWFRNDWGVTLAGAAAGTLIQGGMLIAFSSLFPGSPTLFLAIPLSAALIYGYLSYCAIRALRRRLVSEEELSGSIRCTGKLSIAAAFGVVEQQVRGGPIRVIPTDVAFVSCMVLMNIVATWWVHRWVRLSNAKLELIVERS